MKKAYYIFILFLVSIPNYAQTKHSVIKGETLYSISKKYNISSEDILKANPEIKNGVQENSILTIPKSVKNIVSSENVISHKVEAKETLYSISKKYNVSIEEIIAKNPVAKDGLAEGWFLILPKKSSIGTKKDSIILKKEKVNLFETVNKTRERNLVLLMPFNINRIEKDSSKTKIEYLKTDRFLNITLDFYAGAIKAIDSAKVLGLPINAKVYDAESSKYSSNVATIIKNNDFSNVDVVIGPFTNSFVELAGQLVDKKTAVISPLTNDIGVGGANVFYAMPNETIQKEKLMAYLQTKSDAIFAIHSSSKSKLSTYFSTNYPGVKSFYFNEKGIFDYAILKSNLQKGKKNFVILDSDKIIQVLSVVNNLLKLKKEFDIQLVVIERNDALDFEEIPSKNLAALQMLYPSAIRENESSEALIFAKAYKKDNKVQPNQYATRGFDVTFDTILRMCQEEGFLKSAESQISEQIESQFNYINNTNNGVYMMYYNSDLTIKQAQ
jgi:LysM repeat protein